MTDEDRLAGICIWRTNILCGDHSKCGSCGWNPKVEAQRKERRKIKIDPDSLNAIRANRERPCLLEPSKKGKNKK